MHGAAVTEREFIFRFRFRLARTFREAFPVRWAAGIAVVFRAAARADIDGLAAWIAAIGKPLRAGSPAVTLPSVTSVTRHVAGQRAGFGDQMLEGHGVTRLNATTHTQGFASHEPGPLMDSHKSRYPSRQMPSYMVHVRASSVTPSAFASASLMF